uniref:Uncharacterized protein n=1 Tax=Anguilla anguilla TaxID=7936 RepID=A0A0E9Q600_ANGAN
MGEDCFYFFLNLEKKRPLVWKSTPECLFGCLWAPAPP